MLTLAVALPWLSAKHASVALLGPDVGPVLLGTAAATVLYALIGVGIGDTPTEPQGAASFRLNRTSGHYDSPAHLRSTIRDKAAD